MMCLKNKAKYIIVIPTALEAVILLGIILYEIKAWKRVQSWLKKSNTVAPAAENIEMVDIQAENNAPEVEVESWYF